MGKIVKIVTKDFAIFIFCGLEISENFDKIVNSKEIKFHKKWIVCA